MCLPAPEDTSFVSVNLPTSPKLRPPGLSCMPPASKHPRRSDPLSGGCRAPVSAASVFSECMMKTLECACLPLRPAPLPPCCWPLPGGHHTHWKDKLPTLRPRPPASFHAAPPPELCWPPTAGRGALHVPTTLGLLLFALFLEAVCRRVVSQGTWASTAYAHLTCCRCPH